MADKPPRQSKLQADQGKGRPSVDRAMALRDVMAHAVEVEKDLRKVTPVRNSGGGRGAMLSMSMVLLAFTIFAYMAKPEFIFGANPSNVPEVRRDANVRFMVYLVSRRVESFKNAEKHYPNDLSVIPGVPKGVTYSRVSDSVFELRAKEGTKDIVFRSDEPADRFLGQAPKILSGRGP